MRTELAKSSPPHSPKRKKSTHNRKKHHHHKRHADNSARVDLGCEEEASASTAPISPFESPRSIIKKDCPPDAPVLLQDSASLPLGRTNSDELKINLDELQQLNEMVLGYEEEPAAITGVPLGNQEAMRHHPETTSCAAVGSLVCGILGLVLFGIVFGPIAICLGKQARQEIEASQGRTQGMCMATAGICLGWTSLIFSIIALFLIMGA